MNSGTKASILCFALVAGMMAGTARAAAPYVYVVTNGTPGVTPTAPYTDWATAATDIQTAVDYASTNIATFNIVVVSNGTYTITSQILITNAITVRSFGNGVYGGLANASNTVVQGSGGDTRIFSITNAATVLDGFTIRNGAGRGDGSVNRYLGGGNNWDGHGVYMMNGLVQNCIIKENGLPPSNNSHLQGGGVFMDGGTVSNCTIQANVTGGGTSDGGGIYATGGQILFCRILGNTCGGGGGGGIYASSASVLIRNCLIATNSCPGNGGGVWGGTIESCTIVSNNASGGLSAGGGVYGSTVANSIVLNNWTGSGIPAVANHSSSTFNYSCSTPKPSGAGNVDFAAFVDFGAGDYRLTACPAVDSGTNLAWMTGALDLAGNPRTNGVNNRVDMGAYEGVPGALQCGLAADVISVVVPSNVVFTAYLAGTNRNVTSYTWDFGDGNTTSGATLAVVTNRYTAAGSYTVKLTVVNDANESFTATSAGYITVWGANAFVWTNSPSPGAPYHTWTNASRAIGDAVAAVPAGTTVIVTNSTYNINVQILVDKAIAVRSFGNGVYGGLGNASNTILNGTARKFYITDAGAVIEGLTIQGGRTGQSGYGDGVYMTAGLVRDCIIRDNGFNNHKLGPGVYMTGGTISNCIVRENQANAGTCGGAVWASGSLITHCQIVFNTNLAGGNYGAGVYLTGGSTLRNCLVARNTQTGNGGGVSLNAGAIESCTIVSNTATGDGGGVYLAGGTVRNSIVYWNYVGATHNNLNTTAGLYYSCSTNPGTTANGCITDNPLFSNLSGGDYTLQKTSLCIDAGTNQTWMSGAKDLAGSSRLIKGNKAGPVIVDMGAYETYVPPKGTVLLMR